jgi:hypothetical protein
MEQSPNIPPHFHDHHTKQQMETNRHLVRIGNLLVGVLITTGIVALFILILVSKIR